MKNRKKIAILTAFSLAVVLAGCGNKADEDTQLPVDADSQSIPQSAGTDSQSVPQEDNKEESGDILPEESETIGDDAPQDSTGVMEGHSSYKEYEYDKNGRLKKWIDYHLMGDGFHIRQSMEYEYDESGNMVKAVSCDEKGDIYASSHSNGDGYTEWEYDAEGNLIRVEGFDSFSRDKWSRITWEGFGIGTNWIDHWECDQKGNLEPVYTRYGGGLYEYKYDENGNLMWEASYVSPETPEAGEDTVYDMRSLWYDQNGRIAVVEWPADLRNGSYYACDAYNPNYNSGYDAERFNADYFNSDSWQYRYSFNFCRTYYEYDTEGRLKREVYVDGPSVYKAYIYDYEYDGNGNKIRVLEYVYTGTDSCMTNVYREGDNIIMEGGESALVYEYKWEYDDAGKVTKETCVDCLGESSVRHEWEYDAQGNVSKHTDMQSITLYQYYEDGNLKSEMQYIGSDFRNCDVYDKGGIKIINIYKEEDLDTMEYDDAGMLVHAIIGGLSHEFEYDADGRIIKKLD